MTTTNMNLTALLNNVTMLNAQKTDWVISPQHIRFHDGRMQVFVDADFNDEVLETMNQLLKETGISYINESTHKILLDLLPTIHQHLASKFKVPRVYFDRLLSENNLPLFDETMNHWMQQHESNLMLRMYINKDEGRGMARALLSDSYKPIDNIDVLFAALDAVKESGIEVQFEECAITDERMYIRAVCPSVQQQSETLLRNYRVKSGAPDSTIMTGFVITNSETGNGAFSIMPRLTVKACNNGLVIKRDSFKRIHAGIKLEEYSQINWSEETRIANIALISSTAKDAIATFLSKDYLGKSIAIFEEKGTTELKHPIGAAKNVCKGLAMSDDRTAKILEYFCTMGELNPFGFVQAATYFAHTDNNDENLRHNIESNCVELVDAIIANDAPEMKRVAQLNMTID